MKYFLFPFSWFKTHLQPIPLTHNLPISIQEQALGAPKLNLDGNYGSHCLCCCRSSNLHPPGRVGAAGRGGGSRIVGLPLSGGRREEGASRRRSLRAGEDEGVGLLFSVASLNRYAT
jgi:hypothetical protein